MRETDRTNMPEEKTDKTDIPEEKTSATDIPEEKTSETGIPEATADEGLQEGVQQRLSIVPEEADEKKGPEAYVQVVEAVLFAMGGSVDGPGLAKACGCDARTARAAAKLLQKRLAAEDGALLVKEYNGSYQLCTNPRYYSDLIRLVSVPKKPVLTDVVMETLSIIAFKAPATKVEIEHIRGVKSDHAVNKLIEYGLIEETGRLDAPGRPALFAPTEAFYRRFGVSGKDDLPKLGAEEQALIREEVQEEVAAELSDTLPDGVVIDEAEAPDAEARAEALNGALADASRGPNDAKARDAADKRETDESRA